MTNGKTLGILGGVGPMATVSFMDMIVRMTKAEKDQEHIDMIVLNHATIPDRTAYILNNSSENPLPVMVRDAQRLEAAGADLIVIPCNTAHYFYDEISAGVDIPVLNIIEEAVDYARKNVPELKKLGLLATQGTIAAGSYEKVCRKYGIDYSVPSDENQQKVMDIIYNGVKAGKEIDFNSFLQIIEDMKNDGCDAVILGCTELSVIHDKYCMNRPDVIDSMLVLAKRSITECRKEII